MNSRNQIFISIITPYYNRKHIIERLLKHLEIYDKHDVELIFIDDGSTDGTYKELHKFKDYKYAKIKIFKQENKGPGGARNLGFKNASGKYIWFVDSDDKITEDAYFFLKENDEKTFDFINFNLIRYSNKVFNFTDFKEGNYEVNKEIRLRLLENFGALYTKIFRKSFLDEINFAYPENCINEDYYLYFILPFHFKSFIKTDKVNYIYHDDTESVTRHKSFNNRLFGRQLSAYNGFVEARKYVQNQEEVDILFYKYEKLFYFSALYIFWESNLDGFKRFYLLKTILDNEYQKLKNLYQPYKLKKTKFEMNFRTKILQNSISLIPMKHLDIHKIYEINNAEWDSNINYPFK